MAAVVGGFGDTGLPPGREQGGLAGQLRLQEGAGVPAQVAKGHGVAVHQQGLAGLPHADPVVEEIVEEFPQIIADDEGGREAPPAGDLDRGGHLQARDTVAPGEVGLAVGRDQVPERRGDGLRPFAPGTIFTGVGGEEQLPLPGDDGDLGDRRVVVPVTAHERQGVGTGADPAPRQEPRSRAGDGVPHGEGGRVLGEVVEDAGDLLLPKR